MQILKLFISNFPPLRGVARAVFKTKKMKNNKLIAALIIAVLLTADIVIKILILQQ